MKLFPRKKPFPYLIVKNLYSDSELKYIWRELDFLISSRILVGPEFTASATCEKTGEILKKNSGVFLDDVYTNRDYSNILTLNSKSFQKEIIDEFAKLSFGYESLKTTNHDRTLISYYENNDSYKSHVDEAFFTFLTWFYKEPKQYIGGELTFTNYDHTIESENNCLVIFPSFIRHEVSKISMIEDKPGHGRVCMAQFVYLTDK